MSEQIVLSGTYADLIKRFQCVACGELVVTSTFDGKSRFALHGSKVGVLAFGWTHFKDCCASFGLDWKAVTHLDRSDRLPGVDVVIFHHSSSAPRMRPLVDKVNAAGWTL
jgi:hypothetical protein